MFSIFSMSRSIKETEKMLIWSDIFAYKIIVHSSWFVYDNLGKIERFSHETYFIYIDETAEAV